MPNFDDAPNSRSGVEPKGIDEDAFLAALARRRNLRASALDLGLSRSAASRILADAEARLGISLFLRKGRSLVEAPESRDYLRRLVAFDDARRELAIARNALFDTDAQTLTVATSPPFGRILAEKVLPVFLRQHPLAQVRLSLTHNYEDVFEGGVDVALRRGPLANSDSLIARRLGRTKLILVTSASTLLPASGDVARVQAVKWISYSPGSESLKFGLKSNGARTKKVSVPASFVIDDQQAAIALALAGVGALQANFFLVKQDLHNGRLQEITAAGRVTESVYAVFPRRLAAKRLVKTFIEVVTRVAPELGLWDDES